jgi:hypothetical protein
MIFSLIKMVITRILSRVVFDHSRIANMLPWYLLTAALTVLRVNANTTCGFLKVGFWFRCLDNEPLRAVGPSPWINLKRMRQPELRSSSIAAEVTLSRIDTDPNVMSRREYDPDDTGCICVSGQRHFSSDSAISVVHRA